MGQNEKNWKKPYIRFLVVMKEKSFSDKKPLF